MFKYVYTKWDDVDAAGVVAVVLVVVSLPVLKSVYTKRNYVHADVVAVVLVVSLPMFKSAYTKQMVLMLLLLLLFLCFFVVVACVVVGVLL